MPSKRKALTFNCAQAGCLAALQLPRAMAVKAACLSMGVAGGAVAGSYIGASIGVASGGTAAPATVPLGILGGTILGLAGFVVGDRVPVTVRCGSCGALNRIGRRHIVVRESADAARPGPSPGGSEAPPAASDAPAAAGEGSAPRSPESPPASAGGQGSGSSDGHRRMADPGYRAEQFERRYDAHVLPVNRFVDDLRRESGLWMPYLAPTYGGIEADVLLLLQSPGPGTDDQEGTGSGLLSAENDDPSAGLLAQCLDEAGLDQRRVVVWNAWPWLTADGASPTSGQIKDGLEPLARLLKILPRVRVLVPMGQKANEAWEQLIEAKPDLSRRYAVVRSLLTSARGITEGSQHSKAEGKQRVVDDLIRASRLANESRSDE